MNCIIVDDEKISRDILKKLVERSGFLDLITVCENGLEVVDVLKKEKVDLLFLDIEMPELTGIELLESIEYKPMVIFVTSKPNYAVKAFEHDAVDYLLKPVDLNRFEKAVNKARDIFESKHTVQPGMKNLFVKKDDQLVKIRFTDIVYVEAMADYMQIVTPDNKFIIHTTMKNLVERLPGDDFIRVHRTYTVRKDKIERIKGSALMLQGGHEIPVGGSYKSDVIKSINTL